VARSLTGKIAGASLLAALLLGFGLPIGLYGIGLSNIEGRPEPPMQISNLAIDTVFLQHAFRSREPVALRVLNPWTYAASLVTDGTDFSSDDGSAAAWVIARNYNSSHLKDRRMTFWHLSGAALTIWVSRHWTAEQIVTAAAAITWSRPNPHLIVGTSDEELVRRFEENRVAYDRLRDLLVNDVSLRDVGNSGVQMEDSPIHVGPPTPLISTAKYQEYMDLLKSTGGTRASRSEGLHPAICIGVAAEGWAGDTRHKNICWREGPLAKDSHFTDKLIERNWYLEKD
jgi:hypothetical protein